MFRKFATIFGTLGIIALFIGVIVGMSMLRPKPERQEPQIAPPSVFYTVAESQSVTLDVSAQGEVRPRTDISLTAQVAGQQGGYLASQFNGEDDTPFKYFHKGSMAYIGQDKAAAQTCPWGGACAAAGILDTIT